MNSQLRVKGYVHSVSATSHSEGGTIDCFNFLLQVSESRKRRGVCYDPTKQKVLKAYEKTREPVKFVNFSNTTNGGSGLEGDIVLTKRSRIEAANNDDILFEYEEGMLKEAKERFICVGNIESVMENQVVSVRGCLSVCPRNIQQKTLKDGSVVPMLERCAITDGSGTIRLTLWGDTIKQVKNNKCYVIEDVRVKRYDSVKYLTTSRSTTISPSEEKFPAASKELFESLFDVRKISVEKISLVRNLNKWLSCWNCRRQLSKLASSSTTIVKCGKCSTVQAASSCTINASVRIAIRDGEKHELIWLRAFTAVLKDMLKQPAPDVTLQSCEEEIFEQLFNLRNITLEYSKRSCVIKSVYFDSK